LEELVQFAAKHDEAGRGQVRRWVHLRVCYANGFKSSSGWQFLSIINTSLISYCRLMRFRYAFRAQVPWAWPN